jgi:hypothetical protein
VDITSFYALQLHYANPRLVLAIVLADRNFACRAETSWVNVHRDKLKDVTSLPVYVATHWSVLEHPVYKYVTQIIQDVLTRSSSPQH